MFGLRNISFRFLRLSILCFFLMHADLLKGQITGLRAQAVEFDDDKRLNNVQKMVEDETGLIWLGRWTGPLMDIEIEGDEVLTYDGNHLEAAPKEFMQLLEEDVRLVTKSRNGDFIFTGEGVRYVDPIAYKANKTYKLQDSTLLKKYGDGTIVHAIEGENHIYAVLYYKATPRFTKAILLKSNDQNQLVEIGWLEADDPWVDTRMAFHQGYLIYTDLSRVYFNDVASNRTDTVSLNLNGEQRIHSLAIDGNGSLIVHTGSKPERFFGQINDQFELFKINLQSKKAHRITVYTKVDLTTAYEIFCEDQYVWIIGDGFSIFRLDTNTGRMISFADALLNLLPDYESYTNPIHHWHKDQSGAYWIGGHPGLIRFTLVPDHVKLFMDGKNTDPQCIGDYCSIRGICAGEPGEVFISYENGIKRLNFTTNEITELKTDLSPEAMLGAFDISYFDGKIFWSDKIIDPVSGQSQSLLPEKNSPRVLHTLDTVNHILWLMVNGDLRILYKYNLRTKRLCEISADLPFYNDKVYEVHRLQYDHHSNRIALCAKPFLGLIDTTGKIIHDFTVITDARRFGGPAMSLENSETMWHMQNLQLGLRKININTGEITTYYFEDSASHDVLYGNVYFIQPYEDLLFLGTWKGLAIFDKKTEIIRFFEEEWITREYEFNRTSHLVVGNKLFAGTTQGLIVFDPGISQERFVKNSQKVYLRSIEYQDKGEGLVYIRRGLSRGYNLILPPDHRTLKIRFSVSDYRNSQYLLYSYWLEGYDKDYTPLTADAEINYSYLPPGHYTLHIRGGINQDLRNQSEFVFHIRVKQYWYLSKVAYISYVLLLSGFLWFGYRFNLRRHKEKADAEHLRQLDEFKSEFFTNITHEFRTPLTVILGAAGDLEEKSNEGRIIKRNGKKLLNLINEILDLSKLEAGKLNLAKSQIDAASFIKQLVSNYESLAQINGQTLEFTSNTNEFYADLDQAKLQTVLENLISNAVKFGPDNSKIFVKMDCDDREIRIEVEDEGEGLSEPDANRIFEKFYQAKSGKMNQGSGVGLAICAQLVQLMGGDIEYVSRPGHGGIFALHIPVTRNESRANWTELNTSVVPDVVYESAMDETFINQSAEHTVLIVEDSADIRDHLVRSLGKTYNVEVAENGKIGLEMAREIVPDIILSDVMMPLMDGYELCKSIKDYVGTSHIPVVMLTARADFESRLHGLEEGADAYLSKPFERSELLLVLKNLLKLRARFQSYFNADGGTQENPPSKEHKFIQDLKELLQENLSDEDFGIAEICDGMHISRMQLHRKLKALCNLSTTEFVNQYKIKMAKELLGDPNLNISEISYQVGYSDPSYFTRIFTKTAGMSPSDFRKNNK